MDVGIDEEVAVEHQGPPSHQRGVGAEVPDLGLAPPGTPSGSSRPGRVSVKKAALSSTNCLVLVGAPAGPGDRLDRAHRLAGAAVDALLGVDVALALALVDAVDRAHVDARLVVDVDAGLAIT